MQAMHMEWSEALGAVRRGGELVGCLNFLPELQNQRCSLTLGCELGPCDSDITWAACKLGTMAEDFQNRLDNIFGALDQHNPRSAAPSWSITDRVVQNRGQGRSDSESEDEQEHQECIQVLCDVEEEEGNGLGVETLPSSSACKAFEKEEEEDEFDRLACESLQKLRCRPKPALKTQVAERNIYDRMTSTFTSPNTPSSPASPHVHTKTERKKVRFRETDDFAEDSPAATPNNHGTRSHCTTPLQGPSPRIRRKLVDGEAAVPASPSTVALTSRPPILPSWQSTMPQPSQPHPSATPTPSLISASHPRSHVPEHVRRPEAFTCYVLEHPVTVGSGNDGLSASSAASAASAAAEYIPSGVAQPQGPPQSSGELEPASVQFVSRGGRNGGCSAITRAAQEPKAAWGSGQGSARGRAAVSGADSDIEDGFGGMEAGFAPKCATGADTGGPEVAAGALAGGLAFAAAASPRFTAGTELFVGKSVKRAGKKMRSRRADDG